MAEARARLFVGPRCGEWPRPLGWGRQTEYLKTWLVFGGRMVGLEGRHARQRDQHESKHRDVKEQSVWPSVVGTLSYSPVTG